MTSERGVISYPIPLDQNLPIEAEFYIPSRFVITDVTLGTTTIVTTSVAHDYVIDQQVRLIIPAAFGCFQLNNTFGYVISIPSTTQVEITLDSSQNVNQYIAATSTQVPQILAIGDVGSGQINNSGRINLNLNIPGSFENISPQ